MEQVRRPCRAGSPGLPPAARVDELVPRALTSQADGRLALTSARTPLRARGNPIKKQEDRSGRSGRPGGAAQAQDAASDGSESGSGSGEEEDDEADEAGAEEEFPDLPPAGGPTSHSPSPLPRWSG